MNKSILLIVCLFLLSISLIQAIPVENNPYINNLNYFSRKITYEFDEPLPEGFYTIVRGSPKGLNLYTQDGILYIKGIAYGYGSWYQLYLTALNNYQTNGDFTLETRAYHSTSNTYSKIFVTVPYKQHIMIRLKECSCGDSGRIGVFYYEWDGSKWVLKYQKYTTAQGWHTHKVDYDNGVLNYYFDGQLWESFTLQDHPIISYLLQSQDSPYWETVAIDYIRFEEEGLPLTNSFTKPPKVIELKNGQTQQITYSEFSHSLTIYNPNNYDLTDYQVKVEITDKDVGNQFYWERKGSIRVYDSSGNELPYWVESWDKDKKVAVVWTKVNIPTGGTVQLTLKSSLTYDDKSDGEAVFDLFDDFKGTIIDTTKWNTRGNVVVSNGEVIIKGDGSNGGALYGKDEIFSPPLIVEGKVKYAGSFSVTSSWVGFTSISAQSGYRMGTWWNRNYITCSKTYQGSEILTESTIPESETLTYSIYRLVWTTSKVSYYKEDTPLCEYTSGLYTGNMAVLGIVTDKETSNLTYMDWIRVRKYADQEPTVTFTN